MCSFVSGNFDLNIHPHIARRVGVGKLDAELLVIVIKQKEYYNWETVSMATSFIEYRDNGFWTNDFVAEIPSAYIYIHLAKPNNPEKWLADLERQFKAVAEGVMVGCIDLGFDEHLNSDNERKKLLKILANARRYYNSKADPYDLSDLDEIIRSGYSAGKWTIANLSKDQILVMFDSLAAIIRGEKVEDYPYDTLPYRV